MVGVGAVCVGGYILPHATTYTPKYNRKYDPKYNRKYNSKILV